MDKREKAVEEVILEKDAEVSTASEQDAVAEIQPALEKETAADVQAAPKDKAASVEEAMPEEEKAPKDEAVPEIFFQYREYEVTMKAVTERVKAHYYAKGHQKGTIEDMQIYVKPEDFTAYYVINDGVVGKVNLF